MKLATLLAATTRTTMTIPTWDPHKAVPLTAALPIAQVHSARCATVALAAMGHCLVWVRLQVAYLGKAPAPS